MSRFVPLKMLISAGCFTIMKYFSASWATTPRQITTIRELNGLVHAFIASYLSIAAFLSKPRLIDDLIESSNPWAENCVSISTGYFLADTLIIIFQWFKSSGKDESGFNANICK